MELSQSQKELIESGASWGETGSFLILTIVLSTIGSILIPIAMYRLSKAYENKAIWINTFYAILTVVASIVLFIPLAFFLGISVSSDIFIIAYLFVFSTITGWFLRRAYNELKISSGIEDFGETARWILIGAMLYAVGIGFIFIWIAHYYARRGFKKLENIQ